MTATEGNLKRELRLPDVAAIGINGIVGTGIFFLPGRAAEMLGPAALLTFLIAAVLSLLLVGCFAEVGSRFRGTGGPMRYAEAAFGDLAGFSVGWMGLVARISSWGALANALVTALASISATATTYRVGILCGLFAGLAIVNISGIRWTAVVTNIFTLAKILPILFFIVVGAFFIDTDLYRPFAPHGYSALGQGSLLILFAFVGFEVLGVPAGEMRNPRSSVPKALFGVIGLVVVIYLGIWAVAAGTLPTLAGSASPVVDSAATFLGPGGTLLIKVGILMSVIGVNAAVSLSASRFLYALGARGQVPRFLGSVRATTGAPVPAILCTTALALAIALSGSFVELAVLSVVARFAQMMPTCIAVLVLRRQRREDPPGYRLPFGATIPVLALLLSLWVLSQAELRQFLWSAFALLIGLILYATSRGMIRRHAD